MKLIHRQINRLSALLLALLLFTPALAQEVVEAQDFDIEAVEPYGDIEVGYEPYEDLNLGAIILSATTPDDQHPNFDLVGPDDYWEHFDIDDDPGEERLVTGLLPGIYSVASTDENLELAHSVVEVRAGEIARVHINLQPWEYTAGAYDPYAYNTYYGTYGPGVYPAYPYGGYAVSPYEPYGTADAGAIAVEAPSQEIDYVVTGPNGYSRDFEGDFVLEPLWPGVYVVAATETGYDLAVTTIEVRAEELLPVTPVLVELEANPGEGQEQQNQQTQAAEEQTVQVSLVDFEIEMPQSIQAGRVTFQVTNAGSAEHNFEIEGQGIEEEFESNLQPGETKTMAVNLQPGTYRVYCPVGNHAEQGMEMQLTVTEGDEG